MSLLWMEYETEFENLVDIAFQCEQNANPDYFSKLGSQIKKIIYRDTKYNVDFLYTSYVLNDSKIMKDYARWLYRLMASLMSYRTDEEMSLYVTRHLESISQAVRQSISDTNRRETLLQLLKLAQDNVQDEALHPTISSRSKSTYEPQINEYMQSLLSKNTRGTLYLIQEFIRQGIPLNDIYVEILAESMRRIGDLWHTAKITVDTEHYCTSVTQTAMAQLYPLLFDAPRKDKTLLCACPGTELHEMGARMVADIFENDGWDSIYLGAAVPETAMLEAIRTNQPDLIALSVAMPQHLLACHDLILKIREHFPDIKIAVGGNAFRSTDHIWNLWPVDFYTDDARELLAKANTAFSC